SILLFFFLTVPSTTEIYTLSLHDALPISEDPCVVDEDVEAAEAVDRLLDHPLRAGEVRDVLAVRNRRAAERLDFAHHVMGGALIDRKSTRLNSSHRTISYAVFCLKKKKKK